MTRSTRLDYYELEGVRLEYRPASFTAQIAGSLLDRWAAFWTLLFRSMAPSGEPVIKTWRDRQGQMFYAVYDPTTGQRLTCSSEAEVRQWIEQRYRV